MEKLVKLLNQYEREKEWLPEDFEDYVMWNIEWNKIVQPSCDPDAREYFKYYIISKDYEFIKWLVDNDKIDHKIYEDMKFTAIKQWVLIDKKSGSTAQETREIIKNGCIDTFIALLAISDTPIQDLCVWLK